MLISSFLIKLHVVIQEIGLTKLVFICQAMDLNDNYLASAHSWAKLFEAASDHLSVLSLRVGKNQLINDPIK